MAAKSLGMQKVPVYVAELSEERAKAYRLADNKVADFSIWDNKLLLEELEDLGDFFTGFETSSVFNNVLDEDNSDVLKNNEAGISYEVVFKSVSRERIEKIIRLWDEVSLGEE